MGRMSEKGSDPDKLIINTESDDIYSFYKSNPSTDVTSKSWSKSKINQMAYLVCLEADWVRGGGVNWNTGTYKNLEVAQR